MQWQAAVGTIAVGAVAGSSRRSVGTQSSLTQINFRRRSHERSVAQTWSLMQSELQKCSLNTTAAVPRGSCTSTGKVPRSSPWQRRVFVVSGRSAEQKQRTCTSVCIKASQRRSGAVGSLTCTSRRSVAFKRRAVSRSGAVVVLEWSSKCSRRGVRKRVTQFSTALAVAANDADAADWHPCGSAPPTAGCVWQTAASCAASTPLLRLLRSPVVVLVVVVLAVEETGVNLSSA